MSRTNRDQHGDEILTEPGEDRGWTPERMAALTREHHQTICRKWRVGIGENGHVYIQVGKRDRILLHDAEPPTSGTIRRAVELAYILGKNDATSEIVAECNQTIQELQVDLDSL